MLEIPLESSRALWGIRAGSSLGPLGPTPEEFRQCGLERQFRLRQDPAQSQGNPEQLTSPVSVSGPEIPKILVHTFTREETVESTLSGENNGLNNV